MSLSLCQIISVNRDITEASLPQHWKDALHTSSCWGIDTFIKHVTDIVISSKESKRVSFRVHQIKDSIRLLLIVGFLVMIMILEYDELS